MTRCPTVRVCMLGAISVAAALTFAVGMAPTAAGAHGHGVCLTFDYNDDGEQYCSHFYTMDEVKKYHVDYREFCAGVEGPLNACEASVYFRKGSKTYYAAIKVCRALDGEDEGNVRFMNIQFGKFYNGGYRVTDYQKHPGSCINNIEKWTLFPYSLSDAPVIEFSETWKR